MRWLLLFALTLAACSKGPEADLPSIGEARSLAAEWALVNDAGEPGQAHADLRADDAQERARAACRRVAVADPADSRVRDGNRGASCASRTTRRRKAAGARGASSSRSRTALNPLELTLGIMTAVGGFVDISELVFAAKAGSMFGYALIWAFAFSERRHDACSAK